MGRILLLMTLLVCAFQARAAVDAKPGISLLRLPVEFEANQGQHDPSVRFFSRAGGYQVGLTNSGAIFALPGRGAPARKQHTVELRFNHANKTVEPVGEGKSEHKTHYFIGEETVQQYADIPNFERVFYRAIYPGVDAVFYGKDGAIEYDFVLQPGAKPDQIELEFTGARKIELDSRGDLLVHTSEGVLRQHKPTVYQERGGQRQEVASRYRLLRDNKVKFQLAAFDAKRALTVDPVLSYSTYLGGASLDAGYAIAVDAAGNAYVTGQTYSTNFPALGAYQGALSGNADVFVAKLNPQGSALVYSTYIGGRRSYSEARAIAVDASGSAYIVGTTDSNTYPVTSAAYSAAISGGGAFVTKLSPAGNTLVYSTYLKGASPLSIKVDGAGNAHVSGQTFGNLPTTPGAFQVALPVGGSGSGFVTKFNSTGSGLLYSTYFGAAGQDVINGLAIDSAGNAFLVGTTTASNFPVTPGVFQTALRGTKDAFVAKLNPTGQTLLLSTYLGGTDRDNGAAVAVDNNGRIYVAGDTYSIDFPRLDGYFKPYNSTAYNVAFVTVLNPDAATLAMSTYLGGKACLPPQGGSCSPWDPTDAATAIAVDPSGKNIHVGGFLSSLDVSWLVNPIQASNNARYDAFVAKIEVDPFSQRILNLRYATRLGGDGDERVSGMAVDPQGNAYITGSTSSLTLPTTPGAFRVANAGQQDAFVAKISTLGTPVLLEGGCDGLLTSHLRATLPMDATGSVAFMDNGATIATVPIQAGSAVYVANAAVGVHMYTAVRSSDGAGSTPVYCKIDQ